MYPPTNVPEAQDFAAPPASTTPRTTNTQSKVDPSSSLTFIPNPIRPAPPTPPSDQTRSNLNTRSRKNTTTPPNPVPPISFLPHLTSPPLSKAKVIPQVGSRPPTKDPRISSEQKLTGKAKEGSKDMGDILMNSGEDVKVRRMSAGGQADNIRHTIKAVDINDNQGGPSKPRGHSPGHSNGYRYNAGGPAHISDSDNEDDPSALRHNNGHEREHEQDQDHDEHDPFGGGGYGGSPQVAFTQTQRNGTQDDDAGRDAFMMSSQMNPRRKYWAVFAPMSSGLPPIKLHWPNTNPFPTPSQHAPQLGASGQVRIGRGPAPRFNDLVFAQRRISNRHCVIMRVGTSFVGSEEPVVCIEDLNSSNGTWVNGKRITGRHILEHGDEISLGAQTKMDDHDVRYVFRSVGKEGEARETVGAIYERYAFREVLGSGTFAEVKKAIEIQTGETRAIKIITKHRFANNPKTLKLFEREVDILENLDHDNICRLIETYEDPQHVYLVLEYIDGGDLLEFILGHAEPGPGLPEQQAADFTRMICKAMAYSHELGVTHRDLKPENILLTHDDPPVVKVADFGLAKMVNDGTYLKSMVGTPQYLAPEIVMQTAAKPGYENVVDSWSVGVIVYSMMTNAMPFDEDPEEPVQVRIRNRYTQDFDEGLLIEIGVSQEAINFVGQLLHPDPARRLTLTDALNHPWLSEEQESLPASHSNGDSIGNRYASSRGRSRASTVDNFGGVGDTPRLENMASESSESADDYSFPMTKLHLRTPAAQAREGIAKRYSVESLHGAARLMAGQSSLFGGSDNGMQVDEAHQEATVRRSGHTATPQVQPPRSVILQESPPSPPLTDSALEEHERSTGAGIEPSSISRSVKRKLDSEASSSDLSSPPESVPMVPLRINEREGADTRPAKRPNTNQLPPTRSSARVKRPTPDDHQKSSQTTPRAKTVATRRSGRT